MFFFDSEGRQLGGFDIAVTRDLNGLRGALKQALPGLDIHVEGLGEGLVLTGNVATPIEAQQAFDIASRLVDDGRKVVNGILVHGRDQVMLKVTVAEVQRDIIKQLGIDLNGTVGIGSAVLNLNNTHSVPRLRPAVVSLRHRRHLQVDHRHAAGHGARRRHPHPGRAEPDRNLRRERQFPGRRRVSDPCGLYLPSHGRRPGRDLPIPDPMEEVRRRPQLHSRGDGRRTHQPQGADRGLRALNREPAHPRAVARGPR